ncbi:MAG: MFS transporter, partial [Actinobacteria bacterium]|nr:MFS transporter [Actinomycetota bacterium]
GALGVAILAAVANSAIGSTETPDSLVEGFQAAFAVGAGFAIVGLIATLLLIRTSDSRAHVELGKEAPAAAE